jgi:hypothetical protein
MKTTVAVFWIILSLHSSAALKAQDETPPNFSFEVGGGGGLMNCITDLGGPKKDVDLYLNEINWVNSKFSGSIFLRTKFRNLVGVRLEQTWGSVTAYDSILDGATDVLIVSKFRRNLSFKSSISERAIVAEIYLLNFFRTYDKPFSWTPYLVGGIGWFNYNPKAYYEGKWVELQPLSTSGQGFPEFPERKPYQLKATNTSIGFGFAYEMRLFNIRLELLHRSLSTDQLDDVSYETYVDEATFRRNLPQWQADLANALSFRANDPRVRTQTRGNPDNNDAYLTLSVKFAYKLSNLRIVTKKGMQCR